MKRTLKHILFFILSFVGLLAFILFSVLAVFFFKPTVIVNPKNINFALEHSKVLKKWHWDKAVINHKWVHWNRRQLDGKFKNFCFEYANPAKEIDSCLSVHWNVELSFDFKKGLRYDVRDPLTLESPYTHVVTLKEEDSPPPDYLKLWHTFWSTAIPDVVIDLKKLELTGVDKKTTAITVKAEKHGDKLKAYAYDFVVTATKNKIEIDGPEKIKLPVDMKTKNPLYFKEIKLVINLNAGNVTILGESKIEKAELKITGDVDNKFLHGNAKESDLLLNLLMGTKGELTIRKINQTVANLMKPPYNQFPAPLNVLEGDIVARMTIEKDQKPKTALVKIKTSLDTEGGGEELRLDLNSDFPVDVTTKKIGQIALGVDFRKLNLILPRLEKNKKPPQFKPDQRFVTNEEIKKNKAKKAKEKKGEAPVIHLEALNENILQFHTNLLDEPLRMNFNLDIMGSTVKEGFIKTLPLKTTVFKRKLEIPSVLINFHYPLEPEVIANVRFLLPEYLVTLKIEGPLSKPRTAFASVPPLPEDDIVAVLLFGRPMENLDSEDQQATKTTGQILSQGLLSLSVLYFFAGSPIQSIGYDPESKQVSAQVGLGKKNSLRVARSDQGKSSAGIRRSLGNGWYIDSTVENSTSTTSASNRSQNYGVLLERIIAY